MSATNLEAAVEWLRWRINNGGCEHGAVILSHLRAMKLSEERYEALKDAMVGMKWADTPFVRFREGREDEKYIYPAGFDRMADDLRDRKQKP